MLMQRHQYEGAEFELRKVVAGNEKARGFDATRTLKKRPLSHMTLVNQESTRMPKNGPSKGSSRTKE
jgi:hypothetical protein